MGKRTYYLGTVSLKVRALSNSIFSTSPPLKIELVTRSELHPRAEPVATWGRVGSSIFILGGVPSVRDYSLIKVNLGTILLSPRFRSKWVSYWLI